MFLAKCFLDVGEKCRFNIDNTEFREIQGKFTPSFPIFFNKKPSFVTIFHTHRKNNILTYDHENDIRRPRKLEKKNTKN